MKYLNFLQEVSMAQLRKGRNGVRLVGLGLLVPHINAEEWESTFGKEEWKKYVVFGEYQELKEEWSWKTLSKPPTRPSALPPRS